ncbi:Hypothetical_protein [Hexamita inflata]|uniref:Hypothetical_protein n=1 Tax=Hexamita inflata TaxID=28002 RepID=A0AA86QYT9_9EUKA|nr:Hypothetical protein HINF_LOCUS54208 [Hexamita inflata]
MRKYNRAPPLIYKCTKCSRPTKLTGNKLICQNSSCCKSFDQWIGTPLSGFRSLKWDLHYRLIFECASNCTAKAAALKYNVAETTVDTVFRQFRQYCQQFLDNVQLYQGETKLIDEFVSSHYKDIEQHPKDVIVYYFSIRGKDLKLFRCFHVIGRTIDDVQLYVNKYCKGLTYKHLSATFVQKSANHQDNPTNNNDIQSNNNNESGGMEIFDDNKTKLSKKELYFNFYSLQRYFSLNPYELLDYVWPIFD